MVPSGMMIRASGWIDHVTSKQRALTGLAVARIGLAVSQLSLYTTNYFERDFLYGSDGVFPRSQISLDRTFNLYLLVGSSEALFELLYHIGIIACVALALGFGGRITICSVWATSWSLWGANPMLIDGGDNVVMVVLPMLLLTNCCARLSLRTSARRACAVRRFGDKWPFILLSNAAAFGIMVQLCVVYLFSGLFKAQGQMWVDGTALYYIMRTPEYFYPPLSPLVLENDFAIVLGSYAALLLLIGFPFLVVSRGARLWAVSAMIGFHLGIAIFMGLTSFAIVMIACDCVFVSHHVDRLIARVRRVWPRTNDLRPRRGAGHPAVVTDPAREVVG